MIAENVYVIFKALSNSEANRFLKLIEKDKNINSQNSQKKTKKQENDERAQVIVSQYLARWKKRYQEKIEKQKMNINSHKTQSQ